MIKKQACLFLLLLSMILFPQLATAKVQEYRLELNGINPFIETNVRDHFSYSGLAAFYNGVSAYVVDIAGIKKINTEAYTLKPNQVLALVGHYKILILQDVVGVVSFKEDRLLWHKSDTENQVSSMGKTRAQLLLKSDLDQLPQYFQKIKYAHLWAPLRLLCLGIEAILLWLNTIHSFGWGITIILLSLLFKLFILPANILLTRAQRKVSHLQARLAPELEYIKANFTGEEAHQKFMAVHKQQGVSPFYNLRSLLLTLAPFPFLIAIFNVLSEMDLIAGHPFLWIEDLAYPDAIYHLGFHIPLLGASINLLPILMTLLTILAAVIHQNKIISTKELRKQKLNLYFMAEGFFLLFYPFPSTMVLYWIFANIWQLIQQRFVRI
ncbi:putative inner membrane protein [Candidatus Regiella insecticola LSR1]|uniref:Putative inner membrane protein n=1 Tax=Candidatus Regiella insecticola LSR1 TaxID=663321 RepID=E0WSV5_9ENTR|nr:membrane protein insertase YidC [Candidatus Regiella insecticola]EFL91640.1 putative inner membrane protein [Candidatus Regiella insecticola LSR1]